MKLKLILFYLFLLSNNINVNSMNFSCCGTIDVEEEKKEKLSDNQIKNKLIELFVTQKTCKISWLYRKIPNATFEKMLQQVDNFIAKNKKSINKITTQLVQLIKDNKNVKFFFFDMDSTTEKYSCMETELFSKNIFEVCIYSKLNNLLEVITNQKILDIYLSLNVNPFEGKHCVSCAYDTGFLGILPCKTWKLIFEANKYIK